MAATSPAGVTGLLQRDRLVVLGGLVTCVVLAWGYLLWLLFGPRSGAWPELMAMPLRHGWTPTDLALTFAMWAVMMVAMMTPAAAPIVLLYTTIRRRRGRSSGAGGLLTGYLGLWAAFSVLATLAQWGLHEAALLSHAMGTLAAPAAAVVLIAAGAYQFAPVKRACLTHCQSPLDFLVHHWNDGPLAIGLRHGAYCVGCCWLLMAVLFVVGTMNLAWVVILTCFVIAERLLARQRWLTPAIGVGLIGWATAIAALRLIH